MAGLFNYGVGYKASTIMASQEVMRWAIMSSNGNVVIQTQNRPHVSDPMGVTNAARLYCEKCKQFKVISIDSFLDENRLMAELDWAKEHKHEAKLLAQQDEAPATPGERKLKVVL